MENAVLILMIAFMLVCTSIQVLAGIAVIIKINPLRKSRHEGPGNIPTSPPSSEKPMPAPEWWLRKQGKPAPETGNPGETPALPRR